MNVSPKPRRKLSQEKRNQALLALLRNDHSAIENALQVFARRMEEAAVEARKAFEAGQADAGVKSAQDRTILPNNGLRQSAELFTSEAMKARRIADEIEWLTNDYAHDADDEDESA